MNNYDWALYELKGGKKLRRREWGASYVQEWRATDTRYQPIVFRVQPTLHLMVPYVPAHEDIVGEDWQVIEFPVYEAEGEPALD